MKASTQKLLKCKVDGRTGAPHLAVAYAPVRARVCLISVDEKKNKKINKTRGVMIFILLSQRGNYEYSRRRYLEAGGENSTTRIAARALTFERVVVARFRDDCETRGAIT